MVADNGVKAVAVPFQTILRFGEFRFDPQGLLLTHGSRPLELPPKALEVLAVLVRNAGQVVGKDDLLDLVWPHTDVEEGNLAVHISSLRKALAEHDSRNGYIETFPKRGYRFVAAVQSGLAAGATPPNDPDVLFQMAEHYMQQNTAAACRQASTLYQECIDKNPLNGKARAGMADSLLLRCIRGDLGWEAGLGAAAAVLAETKQADADCADVHFSRSRLHCVWDWQWERATEEAQQGLELATDDATKLLGETWDGVYLARLGDLDGGLRRLKHASTGLTLRPLVWFFLAEAHFLACDFTGAAKASTEALQLHPNCWYLHTMAGRAFTALGDYTEARRQLRRALLLCPEADPGLIGAIAYLHAVTGERDRAVSLLKRMMTRPEGENPPRIYIAMVQAALGDRDGALKNIEAACAGHEWYVAGLKRDCYLDPLRTDSRFRGVLSQLRI